MLRLIIFNALLLGSCGYAWRRGRSDERTVAAICVAASLVSLAVISSFNTLYSNLEVGVLMVDIATLAAFTFVAMRSDRFWPLWVSGLQLTTSVAHFLKVADPGLVPIAYSAAARMWSYPILIILAVGTWRGQRRMRQDRDAPIPG
ncbi:MAG TPA: hypothetical protein VM145_04425 [Sphingomicrobium sp.]|nr:hypothetical protein [Sphingomicrobium sp.]